MKRLLYILILLLPMVVGVSAAAQIPDTLSVQQTTLCSSEYVVDSIYYCGEINRYNVQYCYLYYVYNDGGIAYAGRNVRRQYFSVNPLDADLICKGIGAKNKKYRRKRSSQSHHLSKANEYRVKK